MSAPRLYVVQRPALDVEAVQRFLDDEQTSWRSTPGAGAAENLTELAGRICYFSFGPNQSTRSNSEYIANLISQGHESVLEHVSWTFILGGVSRAFTHQLVRHRVGLSYSQLSQQYHDESEAGVVEPAILAHVPELRETWIAAVEGSQKAYRELLTQLESVDAGSHLDSAELKRMIKTAARSVLPNAIETTTLLSANARALRHFLHLRGAILGDEEMRRVSALFFIEVSSDAPALFADFEMATHSDGLPIVTQLGRGLEHFDQQNTGSDRIGRSSHLEPHP